MIGRHGLGVIVSEKGVSYGGGKPRFFLRLRDVI